jgi:RsiW-degrading membrane proteinase PrsW (M82 family)
MPRQSRRPDPEPLDTDDVLVVRIGIGLWALAFVVLALFFRDDLRRHHATWWLWTCLVGIGLGLWATVLIKRRPGG